jgi:Tol biopolymer transport system component
VHDRLTRETTLASRFTNGAEGFAECPDISGDGRHVAFCSDSNLTGSGTGIHVFDRQTATTTWIGGYCSATGSKPVMLSHDGRWVVFASRSSLVPADTNQAIDYYRWDRTTQQLT